MSSTSIKLLLNTNPFCFIIMRPITIIFLCVLTNCSAQKNAKGNYLMINPWTISFIELNSKNEVEWYTKGCTNEGTTQLGSWTQKADTIQIELKNKLTSFVLVEGKLCSIDTAGVTTELEHGIPQTNIQTKWRVHLKARRVRKRR